MYWIPEDAAKECCQIEPHGNFREKPRLSPPSPGGEVVIDGRMPDADEYAAGPEYQYRQGDSPHGADGAKWHVNAGQVRAYGLHLNPKATYSQGNILIL